MDIGSELRAARKARGATVEQIAALTRIRPSYLEAIERNDFDILPAPIYTRGFLAAYAREVRLDPQDIVQRYRSAFEVPKVTAQDEDDPRHGRHAASSEEPLPDVGSLSSLGGWRSIAVVFLLLWAYLSFLAYRRADPEPGPLTRTAPVDSEAGDARQAVATSGGSPVAIGSGPLRVELHATGPSWVGARADGESVVNRLMQAGDRESLEARDVIVLRAGDPGTLELTINGVRSRPLGKPGQAVTVRIDPQNFGDLLDRPSNAARETGPASH